jgi:hypothetical protein
VYKYALEVSPVVTAEADASKKRAGPPREVKGLKLRAVIEHTLKELVRRDPSAALATEYKSQLVSLRQLELDDGRLIVQVPFEDSDKTMEYNVRFNGPLEIRIGELMRYLNTMEDNSDPEGRTFPKFADTVDVIGVILGHSGRRSESVSVVGSGRFFPVNQPTQSITLGRQSPLSAIRGYFQSVRLGTGRLLLNTNVTHGVFLTPGPLQQIFASKGIDVSQTTPFMKHKLRAISKFLAKTRVECTFRTAQNQEAKRKKTMLGLASKYDLTKALKAQNPPKLKTDWPGPADIEFYLEVPPNSQQGGNLKTGYISVSEYYRRSMQMAAINPPSLR